MRDQVGGHGDPLRNHRAEQGREGREGKEGLLLKTYDFALKNEGFAWKSSGKNF